MIRHYFKVAWRNLLRYRTQSIISIIGLAVGFTCFALATLWLRYEMTYDGFHPDVDRLYQLSQESRVAFQTNKTTGFQIPLATELKQHFPEIEIASAVSETYSYYSKWEVLDLSSPDGTYRQALELGIDSCFLEMFNIRLLNGTRDFLHDSGQIALTDEVAIAYFGLESPLGKEFKPSDDEYASPKIVTAVVSGWGKHSNLPFKALTKLEKRKEFSYAQVWIKLKNGTDVESFKEKLYAYQTIPDQWGFRYTHFQITPIQESRYQLFSHKLVVQFQYLILFSITGVLVIVCALFNYLSLFVNRLRMRAREMALRKVCGSSNGKLFMLLSMEFVLVLLMACVLGMAIIELTLPAFLGFTGIAGNIYGESLLYFAVSILLAMLVFLLLVYYFNKQLFRRAMKAGANKPRQSFFYRFSMVLQMVIGILFIFCICIIMKQINHLRHTDIGMERAHITILQTFADDQIEVLAEKLRQIPLLTEVVEGASPLFPPSYNIGMEIDEWEGKQPTDEPIQVEQLVRGELLTKFYKLRLLQGEFFSDSTDNQNKVLINETAAKKFGWADPVGKKVWGNKTVLGVLKDFHKTSPTTPVAPVLVTLGKHPKVNGLAYAHSILIKDGNHPWETVRDSIHSRLKKELPDVKYNLTNVEEEYEKFLKSETILLELLSIVAVVCILISAFGIYSFVTLTCERRRKEIAIRKVNGARVRDILFLFLKEYAALLLLASAIAFSVGYALMKRWLESYVEQTAISWWVYGAVFAGIACVVLLSIWTRVWKAANQNPAEVIKSE